MANLRVTCVTSGLNSSTCTCHKLPSHPAGLSPLSLTCTSEAHQEPDEGLGSLDSSLSSSAWAWAPEEGFVCRALAPQRVPIL